MRVAVIGAGWAGLAAAIHLIEKGHTVTVLERRGVLGGRATSSRDAVTGDVVDNGTHLMVGAYSSTLGLIRRVGGEHLVDVRSDLRLDYIDDRGLTSLACPSLPAPLHLAAGLLGLRVGWRVRWDALWLGAMIRLGRVPAGATVAALFERARQSMATRRMLWDSLVTAILNESPEVGDAGLFARVFELAFLRTARDSALVFPRCGWGDLSESLGKHIEDRDGTILRRSAVDRLVIEDGRVRGVVCQRRPPSRASLLAGESPSTTMLDAEAVVVAVPWHVVPGLLPEEWRTREPFAGLQGLGASPIVSVELWLDRQVIDREMVGLRGCEMEWVFDKGRLQGRSAAPQHLSFVISVARDAMGRTNRELVASAQDALCRYFPGSGEAQVVRALVLRDPRATFSCTPAAERLRPQVASPIRGLALAGDWTATGLPATIEGAVRSGEAAAEALAH